MSGCTCDDWAEFAQERKRQGLCGTHGDPEPCARCQEWRARNDDSDSPATRHSTRGSIAEGCCRVFGQEVNKTC